MKTLFLFITAMVGFSLQTTAQSTYSWTPFTSSHNIFGVLVSNSRPLCYNEDLNMVSFVHRSSPHYTPSPAPIQSAQANVIVAMISTDDGNSWDSTCIWNNNTYLAGYPQGGIYNPPFNTDASNAFIVGTGPYLNNGWKGNWFASKILGNYNNVAGTAPGAQQNIPNTPPFGPAGRGDFARHAFSVTDDGNVRSVGIIYENINAVPVVFRGANIYKGTHSAGVFAWTGDSVIPDVTVNSNNNMPNIYPSAGMAWSESGEVGYIWFVGCRTFFSSPVFSGYQPIVYMTSNYGQSWSPMPQIDFNSPVMKTTVLDRLAPVKSNPTLTIPFFNITEGLDGIVDENNRLHLVATLVSSAKDHPDSLGVVNTFLHKDGQNYKYRHSPGKRAYIFDFTSSSVGLWTAAVIDSMSSEAPGVHVSQPGFGSNPWTPLAGAKSAMDARIQLSRSADGKYIVYTWAESDTTITASNLKWNSKPNIKARLMDVSANTLHPVKINITGLSTQTAIAGRATMHYISPKFKVINTYSSSTGIPDVDIMLPVTVSNNQGLQQDAKCTHWYATGITSFSYTPPQPNPVSVAENIFSLGNFEIFPNPAKNVATIRFNALQPGVANLRYLNVIGQVLLQQTITVNKNENLISIDIDQFPKGIYFVEMQQAGRAVTRKLVVE